MEKNVKLKIDLKVKAFKNFKTNIKVECFNQYPQYQNTTLRSFHFP